MRAQWAKLMNKTTQRNKQQTQPTKHQTDKQKQQLAAKT
jgi:hypothetical protein